MSDMKIKIIKNGPYLVSGKVPLDEQIMETEGHNRVYRQGRKFETGEQYALCRCGHTKTPPFCDGSHSESGFRGVETASRAPFEERAKVFRGPTLDLYDDGRCAFARFCHRANSEVWTLTESSGNERLREEAIKAACDCPTGRLVQRDKTNGYAVIEPELEPSISVLQDPERGVSGPLYVKGGIPLTGAEGEMYAEQNRYALCRCGMSRNKPFCDAMHVSLGYRDDGDDE